MRIFAVLLIAVWMIGGGVLHLFAPATFFRIVPEPLPPYAVVYVSGVAELLIGIAVLFPRTRALAGLAFALLCIGYLPLHLWDFFRDDPIFPVPYGASIRIAVQLALIGLGFRLWTERTRRD